jgi:hypothetical protein
MPPRSARPVSWPAPSTRAAVSAQEIAHVRTVADEYTQATGWEAGVGLFTVDPAAAPP